MSLGFDDNDTLAGDALVVQCQQAGFIKIRQAGCPDIETQMYCRRDLVDILTAGTLGTNGRQINIAQGDADLPGNLQLCVRLIQISEPPSSPHRTVHSDSPSPGDPGGYQSVCPCR